MKRNAIIPACLIALCGLPAFSQDSVGAGTLVIKPRVAQYNYDAIPKDPLASAFFSATIPGSGQIYNKEYLRGAVTALGFYAGFFLTQYMLVRWEEQNTDTFYVEEYDKVGRWTGRYREVYATRAEEDMEGLPTNEKIVLGASAAAMVGFWVWGVVDSYKGAKRYNTRLMASMDQKLSIKMACSLSQEKVGVNALYRF